MSDEKRNISDINDQKTAEQQAFSEEIRRCLAEPGSGKPTLDEFKVMVYKDREKRRKKRNALVACIVAAFIVGYLTYDDLVPEVGADKNPKETIQTEDGVIIEDGGYGSSNEEEGVLIIDDWKHIEDIKVIVPEIGRMKYVPSGYEFEQLKIETDDTEGIMVEYFFYKKEEKLEVEQHILKSSLNSFDVDNGANEIMSKKGTVYVYYGNNKRATMQTQDGCIISIWGNISDEEFIKIINNYDY